MAHDRQVDPDEMIPLPESLQERKKESSKPTANQSESLEVLRDWWQVFAAIYRDDPTEILATAFRETLSSLKPGVLHQACLMASRESPRFRPTPGRIYELAELLMAKGEKGNRPEYLDDPKLPVEEREAELATDGYQKLREKIMGRSA